jgi:hypothetical protein
MMITRVLPRLCPYLYESTSRHPNIVIFILLSNMPKFHKQFLTFKSSDYDFMTFSYLPRILRASTKIKVNILHSHCVKFNIHIRGQNLYPFWIFENKISHIFFFSVSLKHSCHIGSNRCPRVELCLWDHQNGPSSNFIRFFLSSEVALEMKVCN